MRNILFLFIFCLFAASTVTAQPNKCKSCIEWDKDKRLKWSDFKGKPNTFSKNHALTDSGMSISMTCVNDEPTVQVESFFNPQKSWTKNKTNDHLLEHEQLHFDITELFVRKLRKQLSLIGKDCGKLNQHIEEYYNKNYTELVSYQANYDRDTKHSMNSEAQKRWRIKVNEELERLKQYSALATN
ncbi:DUF922 domain-containing protein [Bacteroidota bacterium]